MNKPNVSTTQEMREPTSDYDEILAGTVGLGYLDCTLLEYALGIKYFIEEELRKPNCDTHLINLLRRAACVGWENIHLFKQSPIVTRASDTAKWLPIEAAPKGLKLIVGYFNPLGKWRSVMGRYYFADTLESETEESGFAPAGWYEETEAYEYLMPMDQEPTHFQFLSGPPTIRRDSTGEKKEDAK